MQLDITQNEINTLWDKGYRPWEIYICNDAPVNYCGELKQPGEITGWDIKHIFATREAIKTYPFFDVIIIMDCVASCTEIWEGA
jgi:hypothetical protein|tara:strand:- start:354 stop:605 length:252 start_codon:yes stop_codon:yes gene_type:complete